MIYKKLINEKFTGNGLQNLSLVNLKAIKIPILPKDHQERIVENLDLYLEGNYKATSNWLLTAGLNYRSSQYADDMNQIKLDGYSLLDLRTTYNTNIFGLDVEFFAKVDNVFDEQYFMMPRVTGDRNDDGEYNIGDMGLTVNPGRTYLMGLSAKF